MSPSFLLSCTIFLLSTTLVFGANEGVLDKIKAGLRNAKNYLDKAREIADLVSKSLKTKQNQRRRGDDAIFVTDQESSSSEPVNVLSSFFRLLGLDSKKITAVAVNSFVFVAQMIGELFKLKPKVEQAKATDPNENVANPIRLIIDSESEKIQNLLKQAYDKDLPDRLIEHTEGFDSTCVKLLLCKTTPVIWAVQKSLKNGSINGQRDITSWLPSREKFEEHSDACDDKYSDCRPNYS